MVSCFHVEDAFVEVRGGLQLLCIITDLNQSLIRSRFKECLARKLDIWSEKSLPAIKIF